MNILPPLEDPFVSSCEPPLEHNERMYSLRVVRLVFVDTAEGASQRLDRARGQWGSYKPIGIQVMSESTQLGGTSFKPITSNHGWIGIDWEDGEEAEGSNGGDICLTISGSEGLVLVLEVVGMEEDRLTYGVGMLNTGVAREKRCCMKFPVYLFPTQAAVDCETVYAIAEVEIRSSVCDRCHFECFDGPECVFGPLRLSTVNFYFPSFILNDSGCYVVSNVLSVFNVTTDAALAIQLVPLRDAHDCIYVEPSCVVTVDPQERVFFSATWKLGGRACMRKLEAQIVVNGSVSPSVPIIINIHNTTPQPCTTDVPYHYWLNTTCVTNTQLSPADEFPSFLDLLPAFRLSTDDLKSGTGCTVVRDADKRRTLNVDAITIVGAPSGRSLVYSIGENSTSLVTSPFSVQKPNTQIGLKTFGPNVPTVNISQKTCQCIVRLGRIRGFPMVSEFAASVSSAFQVTITLLDQQGWKVVVGETRPQYQSASGNIQWEDELELWKWPGAKCRQFLRLNLMEVRPYDGDAIPIGAALVSLNSLERIRLRVGFNVAFYVYETYSLYDTLHTSSLLMTDASITFKEMPA
ncbi:unnamed protein product, partial [Trypanosoma congolense IL3000]